MIALRLICITVGFMSAFDGWFMPLSRPIVPGELVPVNRRMMYV